MAEPPSLEPKVFVRALSTPAGLPWDQARAAALEARLGAPLPIGELAYQLRRLDRWSPGAPSRWAAFYIRTEAVGDRFEANPVVDGQPVPVVFTSRAERRRRSRKFLRVATSMGLAIVICLGAGVSALSIRGRAEAELANAEQVATARLTLARRLHRLKAQTRALDGASLRERNLGTALADLAWAAAAKAPDARLLAVHWDHGLMVFEVKGETVPFTSADRAIKKAEKAVAPGVTLWGVGPAVTSSDSARNAEGLER